MKPSKSHCHSVWLRCKGPTLRDALIELDGEPMKGVTGVNIEASVDSMHRVTVQFLVRDLAVDIEELAEVSVEESSKDGEDVPC